MSDSGKIIALPISVVGQVRTPVATLSFVRFRG